MMKRQIPFLQGGPIVLIDCAPHTPDARRSVVLAIAAAVMLTVCQGRRPGASAAERDLPAAVNSVVTVQKCAALASAAGGEQSYTSSLAELARMSGVACISDSVASGHTAGSLIHYFPLRDSSGEVRGFWVMSRDVSGRPGTPAYIGDENGRVFEAGYDPRWENTRPADTAKLLMRRSPVIQLRNIWKCIRSNYSDYGGLYPVDLSRADYHHPAPHCIATRDQNNGVIDVDIDDRSGGGRFALRYQVGDRSFSNEWGPGFSVSVRPITYGNPSIRSFITDANGGIHFTTQQREATVDDPLVFGCEGPDAYHECTVAQSIQRAGISTRSAPAIH
jgi:hypothetical protein